MSQITTLRIDRLTVSGFSCFAEEQSWDFGGLTTVSGHNGQGKSTIADAIAFGLTGAPFFGGRNLDALHCETQPLLSVRLDVTADNGARHTILRTRRDSRAVVSVDGAETTQARFAGRFGDKDLLLSLLNPLYFTEVLGADGRGLLEPFLPAVPHEAVLAKLSEHTRAALDGENLGTPETYLKNRRDERKALEKDRLYQTGQYEQTESTRAKLTQALAEKQAMLSQMAAALSPLLQKRAAFDGAELEAEIGRLGEQYDAARDEGADHKRAALEQHLAAVRAERYRSASEKPLADMTAYLNGQLGVYRDEQTRLAALRQQGVCPTCLRRIDEGSLPEIEQAFQARLQQIQTNGAAVRQRQNALAEQEQTRRRQFDDWQNAEIDKMTQLLQTHQPQSAEQRRQAVKAKIKELSAALVLGGLNAKESAQFQELSRRQNSLQSEIDQITSTLNGLPQAQKEGLIALDAKITAVSEKIAAAKAYLSERAALLFAPVRMPHTELKLYESLKETGEVRDVFKLTYNGRDYVRLSLSERTRCGLETVALLSRLSGRRYPLFVDNTESFCDLGDAQPSGQLILARVAKGQALTVQDHDAPRQKAG